MQASQGLRSTIKDCCNFERISGLAFSIFNTGDQAHSCNWTKQERGNSVWIITNPFHAWSYDYGYVIAVYYKCGSTSN